MRRAGTFTLSVCPESGGPVKKYTGVLIVVGCEGMEEQWRLGIC